MHLLAAVVIPYESYHAEIRPAVARDAALNGRLEMLLYQFMQPDDDWKWGIDHHLGFQFDWWALGGSYDGWGRDVRSQMARQRVPPIKRAIPRFIERNAIWTDDLARVRLAMSLVPHAVLTPHGVWHEPSMILFGFGKQTVREKRARAAWLRKIRKILQMYAAHLAVAVDYHF